MDFYQKLRGYWGEGFISSEELQRIIVHVIIIAEWDFERKVKINVHFVDDTSQAFIVSPKSLFQGAGPYEDGGCNAFGNESMNEEDLMDNLDSSERTYFDQAFDSPEIDHCPNDQVLPIYPGRFKRAA